MHIVEQQHKFDFDLLNKDKSKFVYPKINTNNALMMKQRKKSMVSFNYQLIDHTKQYPKVDRYKLFSHRKIKSLSHHIQESMNSMNIFPENQKYLQCEDNIYYQQQQRFQRVKSQIIKSTLQDEDTNPNQKNQGIDDYKTQNHEKEKQRFNKLYTKNQQNEIEITDYIFQLQKLIIAQRKKKADKYLNIKLLTKNQLKDILQYNLNKVRKDRNQKVIYINKQSTMGTLVNYQQEYVEQKKIQQFSKMQSATKKLISNIKDVRFQREKLEQLQQKDKILQEKLTIFHKRKTLMKLMNKFNQKYLLKRKSLSVNQDKKKQILNKDLQYFTNIINDEQEKKSNKLDSDPFDFKEKKKLIRKKFKEVQSQIVEHEENLQLVEDIKDIRQKANSHRKSLFTKN